MVHVDYLMAPVNSRRVRTRKRKSRACAVVEVLSSAARLLAFENGGRVCGISVNQFELIVEAFENNLRGKEDFLKACNDILPTIPWLCTNEWINRRRT